MFQVSAFLASGFLTGILLSAPIGPANVLCLERTLKSGANVGFVAGAGAALGDFLFVIAALAGIVAIGDLQSDYMPIMKYLGSLILVIFGVISLYKGVSVYTNGNAKESLFEIYAKKRSCQKTKKLSAFSGFLSNFILTTTNPLTPIGVISAVAAVGLGGGMLLKNPLLAACIFAAGIAIGSLGWWYGLTRAAEHFAQKLTGRSLSAINFIGSALMLAMAGYILIKV